LPTVTAPKLRLEGLDPNVPNAVPVPASGIVRIGLDAFELIVTSPLMSPLEVGENVTLKLAICPGLSVSGAVIPLRANPVPLTPTCEMVTLVPPEFVIVSSRA
jgi:hypothetical protein